MPINFDWISSDLSSGEIASIGIIVTISIFIISQGIVIHSKKKETNERISRVCKTLKVQVHDLGEFFKGEEYEALKTRHYTAEHSATGYAQKKEYSERIFNTAPYDSVVNSGLITYLKEGTQSKLNEFYFYISLHNKRMFDLAQIYNDKASSAEFKFENIEKLRLSLAWELNEIELSRYEEKMQELIDELEQILDKEIDDAGSSIVRKFFRLKHTYKS